MILVFPELAFSHSIICEILRAYLFISIHSHSQKGKRIKKKNPIKTGPEDPFPDGKYKKPLSSPKFLGSGGFTVLWCSGTVTFPAAAGKSSTLSRVAVGSASGGVDSGCGCANGGGGGGGGGKAGAARGGWTMGAFGTGIAFVSGRGMALGWGQRMQFLSSHTAQQGRPHRCPHRSTFPQNNPYHTVVACSSIRFTLNLEHGGWQQCNNEATIGATNLGLLWFGAKFLQGCSQKTVASWFDVQLWHLISHRWPQGSDLPHFSWHLPAISSRFSSEKQWKNHRKTTSVFPWNFPPPKK